VPEVTLQSAIDDLYRLAVLEGKSTSTKRLSKLAEVCVHALGTRGLHGARAEVRIPGGGREKDWDIAWEHDAKFRLVISLKSILKNLAGTVPNRLDDAMGETANIQLYSPEIVTGYIVIVDVSQDVPAEEGHPWTDKLAANLTRLSGRRAPYWAPGTFESFALVKVDFSIGPRILSGESELHRLLDELVAETIRRNPGIRKATV
jgi:hypothetical protein